MPARYTRPLLLFPQMFAYKIWQKNLILKHKYSYLHVKWTSLPCFSHLTGKGKICLQEDFFVAINAREACACHMVQTVVSLNFESTSM